MGEYTQRSLFAQWDLAGLFQMAELVPNHKKILIEHVIGPLVMAFVKYLPSILLAGFFSGVTFYFVALPVHL